MKPNSAGQIIPSLDGFRAISILIVFFGHSFRTLPIPGGLGVTIFFFISGYLITTLLIREFDRTGSIDLKDFYIRRLYRLMPPLLITMALGAALVLLGLAQGNLDSGVMASQIFFYYNYWDAHHANDAVSGLGILWSLSVEEHFYFVFPALFIASSRRNWSVLWVVAAGFSVLLWRTVKFVYLGADEWQIYSLTDTRIDSILWGCFLAMLISVLTAKQITFSKNQKLVGFLAGCFVILLTLYLRGDTFRSTVRYSLQSISLIPIFYYALTERSGIVFQFLNNSVLGKIGTYSYTIYLVHYIILNALNFNQLFDSPIAYAAVAAVLSVSYAAAMNRFVEIPVKQMRQARNRTTVMATDANSAKAGK